MGKPLPKPVARRYFVRVVKGQVTGIARPAENELATIRFYVSAPEWKEVSRDVWLQHKGALEGFNAR